MKIQEKLAQIRLQQAEFLKAQTALDASLQKMESELESTLSKLIKKHKLERGLYIHLIFSGGHAKNWDPYYHIYHIRGDVFNSTGWISIDGKWVFSTSPNAGKVYLHHLDFKKKLDVKMVDALENFKAELEAESGLRVNIGDHKIVTKGDVEVPKSVDDLRTIHDGGAIMASGEKLHVGWDIGDPWAIVRTRKSNLVVYYSTNGHGFGYNHCVMPDQSVEEFLTWMGADLSDALKNTLKESRS